MKNLNPLYHYGISVVCFVIANLVGQELGFVYGAFLGAGCVIFLLGFYKRISSK